MYLAVLKVFTKPSYLIKNWNKRSFYDVIKLTRLFKKKNSSLKCTAWNIDDI